MNTPTAFDGAWICPTCGHFVERTTTRPCTPCQVDMIPYIDANQADEIRRRHLSRSVRPPAHL